MCEREQSSPVVLFCVVLCVLLLLIVFVFHGDSWWHYTFSRLGEIFLHDPTDQSGNGQSSWCTTRDHRVVRVLRVFVCVEFVQFRL